MFDQSFDHDSVPENDKPTRVLLFRIPPKRNRGIPLGGSDGEEARVRAIHGPGIDEPLRLGNDVISPLEADEPIYGISVGQTTSKISACNMATKHVSLRYGHHNIAHLKAWKNKSGVHAQLSENLVLKEREIFCDNIVVETSASFGSSHIYVFLKALGLHVNHNQKDFNPFLAASVKMVNSKHGSLRRFKVALADISLSRLGLILEVLKEGSKHSSSEDSEDLDETQFDKFWKFIRDTAKLHNVNKVATESAVKSARFIKLKDTDLTCDLPGTLNADQFKDTLLKAGFKVNEKSKTGVNCVKTCDEHDFEGSSSKSCTMMGYNKVQESLENNGTGSDSSDIGCKAGYLLNPSTKHLTDVLHDPDYYNNGVTRFEIKFKGDWELAEMQTIMAYRLRLLDEVRVQCSIHEHIAEHEQWIGTSVGTFFPANYLEKCQEISQNGGGRCSKEDKKRINRLADGHVVRYCNSDTGKYSGLEIKQKACANSRSSEESAWSTMSRALAWSTTCGSEPKLFLAVAGIGSIAGGDFMHIWFRLVKVRRICCPGYSLLTYIFWDSTFKNNNKRNKLTDWAAIGVDIDSLNNFKIALVDPNLDSFTVETMGIGLQLEGAGMELVEPSIHDTIALERATGIQATLHSVQALPDDEWHCASDYYVDHRKAGGQVVFKYAGDRYKLPADCTIYKEVKQSCGRDGPKESLHVRYDHAASLFQCKMGASDTLHMHVRQPKKTEDIPVKPEPQRIVAAGEKQTGRPGKSNGDASGMSQYVVLEDQNAYWIPYTIRKQLRCLPQFIQCGRDCNKLLSECFVVHTKNLRTRVMGGSNPEELMAILDSRGMLLAENTATAKSFNGKRKRGNHTASGAGQHPEPKRQHVP